MQPLEYDVHRQWGRAERILLAPTDYGKLGARIVSLQRTFTAVEDTSLATGSSSSFLFDTWLTLLQHTNALRRDDCRLPTTSLCWNCTDTT